MLWLLTRIIVWPAQVAAFTTVLTARFTAFGARSGWRSVRFIGLRRLALFGTGLLVGLLLAPWPGREMRERLKPRPDADGNLVWAPFGDLIRVEKGTDDTVAASVTGVMSGRRSLHLPKQADVEVHVETAPVGDAEAEDESGDDGITRGRIGPS